MRVSQTAASCVKLSEYSSVIAVNRLTAIEMHKSRFTSVFSRRRQAVLPQRPVLYRALLLLALLAFATQTLGAAVCVAMLEPSSVPEQAQEMSDCHSESTTSTTITTSTDASSDVAQHDCCDNCNWSACHASSAAVSKLLLTLLESPRTQLSASDFALLIAPAKNPFRPPIRA